MDPPIFSLSQGGHPPVDPPSEHILYEYRTVLYCTVGIFEELVRHGSVQYCNKLCGSTR